MVHHHAARVMMMVFALSLGGMMACDNKNAASTSQTNSKGKATTPKVDDKNAVKLGAVLPLSGQTATYGEEALNGMKLAVDEINAKSTPKLKLIFKDNKGDSTETAKLVGQLITVDKVNMLLGAVASTNSLKGAKVAQENGIPMMTPASTNVDITKKGDFISRICFIDPVQGGTLASFALNDLKKKKAAIIMDKGSDYSVGLVKAFKAVFTKGGGTIVGEESFTAGDSDFSALITKVSAQAPDVLFIPAYYGDVGPMLKQAGDKWKAIPVLAGDGIDSPDMFKLMGSYGGDVYMSTHFSPDDTDKKVKDFVQKYRETYVKKPGAMAALGYDTVYAVHDALKRAKGADPKKLKAAINGIKDLVGVTGKITLDAERNAQKDVVILKVSPSGTTFHKRIAK